MTDASIVFLGIGIFIGVFGTLAWQAVAHERERSNAEGDDGLPLSRHRKTGGEEP